MTEQELKINEQENQASESKKKMIKLIISLALIVTLVLILQFKPELEVNESTEKYKFDADKLRESLREADNDKELQIKSYKLPNKKNKQEDQSNNEVNNQNEEYQKKKKSQFQKGSLNPGLRKPQLGHFKKKGTKQQTEKEKELKKLMEQKMASQYDMPKIDPTLKIPDDLTKLSDVFLHAYNLIQPAKFYHDIQQLKVHQELPFCGVIKSPSSHIKEIAKGFCEKNANYTNKQLLILGDESQQQIIKICPTTPFFISPNPDLVLSPHSQNYYQYKDLLKAHCKSPSVIVMLENPLRQESLSYLNDIYQEYNIWATTGVEQYASIYQFQSFYLQLFENIDLNDFQRKNSDHLKGEKSMSLAILSMMVMGKIHIYKLDKTSLYKTFLPSSSQPLKTTIDGHEQIPSWFYEYQTLYSLSQNFPISEVQNYDFIQSMLQLRKTDTVDYTEVYQLTRKKVIRASQYVQLKNLPTNHSLYERERIYYRRNYWKQLVHERPETRFCVIVISHNNIEHNRYYKVLQTIRYQDYENYHIVFIDDESDDATFPETKKTAKEMGWVEGKDITFILNEERRFSTYNIKNAAHNVCKKGEVILLVDGDDQLIGTQVFKLMSSFYGTPENYWIVYTSYFSNLYTYGASKPPSSYPAEDKRKQIHVIGAIRSFYRDLYEKIDIHDHKNPRGQWLDTLYDEAMQYPMMEMAGLSRLKYIPEICYLYNRNYGDNDDSTQQKIKHRLQVFYQILERPSYKTIQAL